MKKKIIPYVDLKKQFKSEKKNILKAINSCFKSGNFILGNHVEMLEKKIANYCGAKYCVALNSGTDALTIALHLLGVKKGDEVITPPNSFIASTAAIVHLGAIPVFADVLEDQNIDPAEIKKKISKKTSAIMPVHLAGKPCKMIDIIKISKKYKIPVVEDAAQAIGTKLNGKMVGTFGEVGCFSAHPLKNLNAVGDSGYLITNKKNIYEKAKLLRNHGIKSRKNIKFFGYVSRMDSIQAAVLIFRLKNLNTIINKRRNNAKFYKKFLQKIVQIKLPFEDKGEFSTYHTYVVQVEKRDKLQKYLKRKGINTLIHYPILINKSEAYKRIFGKKKNNLPIAEQQSKNILTLPINQFLRISEIKRICESIELFYKQNEN